MREGGVPPKTGGLIADTAFTEISESLHEGRRAATLVIQGSERAKFGPTSETFNPLYFLAPSSEDLAVRFRIFLAAIEKGTGDDLKVSRENDTITVESITGEFGTTHVVDLAQGGNLASYHGWSPGPVKTEYTFHYASQNGVWVPKQIEYSNAKPSGTVTRRIDWLESRVNAAVPDDAFSLESIGVEPGDRIYDSRSKTTIYYKDESPVAKPRDDNVMESNRTGGVTMPVVLGVNIIAVVAIAVAWSIYRHRLGQSHEKAK
jgi:hypothetical protein